MEIFVMSKEAALSFATACSASVWLLYTATTLLGSFITISYFCAGIEIICFSEGRLKLVFYTVYNITDHREIERRGRFSRHENDAYVCRECREDVCVED